MVTLSPYLDTFLDLSNLTLDYHRGRYWKLFSSLIFVNSFQFSTIGVATTGFSGLSSFHTYILLDGVMQNSMRFEAFFPLYFLFCKALHFVIDCNRSKFLDSRPFQQAIIWRNRLRNEFRRAILTWELLLQYFFLFIFWCVLSLNTLLSTEWWLVLIFTGMVAIYILTTSVHC